MASKPDTQLKALRAFIKQHGSITPLQALRKLGIYRLSARVHDLRASGMKIKTALVKSSNGKRYAKYVVVS